MFIRSCSFQNHNGLNFYHCLPVHGYIRTAAKPTGQPYSLTNLRATRLVCIRAPLGLHLPGTSLGPIYANRATPAAVHPDGYPPPAGYGERPSQGVPVDEASSLLLMSGTTSPAAGWTPTHGPGRVDMLLVVPDFEKYLPSGSYGSLMLGGPSRSKDSASWRRAAQAGVRPLQGIIHHASGGPEGDHLGELPCRFIVGQRPPVITARELMPGCDGRVGPVRDFRLPPLPGISSPASSPHQNWVLCHVPASRRERRPTEAPLFTMLPYYICRATMTRIAHLSRSAQTVLAPAISFSTFTVQTASEVYHASVFPSETPVTSNHCSYMPRMPWPEERHSSRIGAACASP